MYLLFFMRDRGCDVKTIIRSTLEKAGPEYYTVSCGSLGCRQCGTRSGAYWKRLVFPKESPFRSCLRRNGNPKKFSRYMQKRAMGSMLFPKPLPQGQNTQQRTIAPFLKLALVVAVVEIQECAQISDVIPVVVLRMATVAMPSAERRRSYMISKSPHSRQGTFLL